MSSRPLTNRLILTILSECVSRINSEFIQYYPALNQPNLEHTDKLREYGILKASELMGEEVDMSSAIINLARTTNVRGYGEHHNAEINYDLEFDDLCNRMNQENNIDVRTLTVREFYSLFNYIKKQQKKMD